MTENFPNLMKETNIQVQEAHRVPNKMNSNRPVPCHIIIKMSKVKTGREKKVIYKRTHIRLSARIFSRNFAGQKGVA